MIDQPPSDLSANPPRSRPAAGRADQAAILAVALAILLAGTVLTTPDDQTVEVPFLRIRLPTLCWARQYLGFSCAGCGLTRSMVHIGHGRWGQAWRLNPGAFLVYGLVLAQIPWRLVQLDRLRRGRRVLPETWLVWAIVASAALLLLIWVARHMGGVGG